MNRILSHVQIWLLGAFIVCGCTTTPVTGRKQLNFISPSQETQLGLTAFAQMKKEVPISKDSSANALLQKVGKRIAAAAGNDLPGAQWEFVVFDSKEVNAFCLPGGKIGVYTGILPITKNEEGLATVIGHEVAHASAHHGGERISHAVGLQTVGQVLGAATANSQWQAATMAVYGVGAKVGLELPHSRRQESEADEIGLTYMAQAGYNPEAAVEFWQRFDEYGKKAGDGGPWFLRTHPVNSKRIEDLKALMPKAKAQYKRPK